MRRRRLNPNRQSAPSAKRAARSAPVAAPTNGQLGAASGPLVGYRVVELAGIGPAPFAGMMLSDMGAEVLRVDRLPGSAPTDGFGPDVLGPDVLARGKRSVAVDLNHPGGRDAVIRLVEHADALIEGYRPGVMERFRLGPDDCLARNPRLVYGRMTGWGRDGPYSQMAGHDINYIALSGTLSLIGREGEPPVPPLNLLGDFGGGALMLVIGIVSALLERSRSGKGQVVDAAMIDGAALLAAPFWGYRASGFWQERGTNLLDGAAPHYDVYETADGEYVSFGAIEPRFYATMASLIGLAEDGHGPIADQNDRTQWPAMKERVAAVVRTRTRDEWCALLEGTDACFAPVLPLEEAPAHPHMANRDVFTKVDGLTQPAPAPRFSRTPGAIQGPPSEPGQHTKQALIDWGFDVNELDALLDIGAVI